MLNSNILEYTTRLAKETNSAFLAQSNLQAVLDRRTADLASFSNRLVQTRQQLEREEAALLAARSEISAKAATLGALEVQRDELQRQATALPGLEREAATWREKLNKGQFEYVSLQESFGRVSVEKADLERKLQDPLFLRRQAQRVEQAAELRQRAAANQPIKVTDPRLLLDLQPDGTVRPAIATSITPK
jgi:chromosome segregation ATPase